MLLNTHGIVSTTTLNPGLNTFDTDLLLLNRIVCSNADYKSCMAAKAAIQATN